MNFSVIFAEAFLRTVQRAQKVLAEVGALQEVELSGGRVRSGQVVEG